MSHNVVSDRILRDLVTCSHAEGTTSLAVAAGIEHQGRTLLISTIGDDFETIWQLPSGPVLPGETLLQGLDRVLSLTTGLRIVCVTGYAGHHDRVIEDELIRTFVFNVAVEDPERVCRWANVGHRWTAQPITLCATLGHSDSTPDSGAIATSGHNSGASASQHIEAALRAGARGLLCAEAAIELIVEQQSWLERADFVSAHIDRWGDTTDEDAAGVASIDWVGALDALDAGQLPCSSGEAQLLRIAGSLAEGIPIDLRDNITSLDSTSTGLVARALCHAAGHRP